MSEKSQIDITYSDLEAFCKIVQSNYNKIVDLSTDHSKAIKDFVIEVRSTPLTNMLSDLKNIEKSLGKNEETQNAVLTLSIKSKFEFMLINGDWKKLANAFNDVTNAIANDTSFTNNEDEKKYDAYKTRDIVESDLILITILTIAYTEDFKTKVEK